MKKKYYFQGRKQSSVTSHWALISGKEKYSEMFPNDKILTYNLEPIKQVHFYI